MTLTFSTMRALVLLALFLAPGVNAATCGNGNVGDGVCAQTIPGATLCCSTWGWCGTSTAHCGSSESSPTTPTPGPAPITPTPTISTPSGGFAAKDDNRLMAYLGNWQTCPTAAQLAQYTHVVIAFAVTYTWNPTKNSCSQTCDIATPPICENAANPTLISDLQAAGKKVILSFGGAGMGGSWDGDVNDCWEYCFGRETQVVDRLVAIVNELGVDGVDIDYEYFYEDGQYGSNFSKGAEAIKFLEDVTVGLRNKLPAGSIVAHVPMDSDVVQGTDYYEMLKTTSWAIDFVMPQYYNGFIKPALDGIDGTGVGRDAALPHYTNLVSDMFGGDASKVVFGFCISDCSATSSNASGSQAAIVMTDLSANYRCNGGAFFWVAQDDVNAGWSTTVNQVVQQNAGCSSGTIRTSPPIQTAPPTTSAPVPPAPTPATSAPVVAPDTSAPSSRPSLRGTTRAPVNASGAHCCSYDLKTCTAGWCNGSQSNCSECGGSWLIVPGDDDNVFCTPKWGACTGKVNSCCSGSTCQVQSQFYSQCL